VDFAEPEEPIIENEKWKL